MFEPPFEREKIILPKRKLDPPTWRSTYTCRKKSFYTLFRVGTKHAWVGILCAHACCCCYHVCYSLSRFQKRKLVSFIVPFLLICNVHDLFHSCLDMVLKLWEVTGHKNLSTYRTNTYRYSTYRLCAYSRYPKTTYI